jgi:UDP-glucuronate 4-epimerase
MKVLITGTAGFIGFHLAEKLIHLGHEVVGLDNINDYYDVQLKYDRLAFHGMDPQLASVFHQIQTSSIHPNYQFVRMNLEDKEEIMALFEQQRFDVVVNLAAQAGVRYSLTNPDVYVSSNVQGFLNILEAARKYPVKNLVYASSSSVYGLNKSIPFQESQSTSHPISLYAASKKANEMMAHTYSQLFGIPTIGLRFFTVYGPWGRPDMALFLFTKAITEGKTFQIFNHGDMSRDFTYVGDIVESIKRLIDTPAKPDPNWDPKHPNPAHSSAPYRIYNIGHNSPVQLMDYVSNIEKYLGMEAKIEYLPLQDGDVPNTWADVSELIETINFKPQVKIEEGIDQFVKWYTKYYKIDVKKA